MKLLNIYDEFYHTLKCNTFFFYLFMPVNLSLNTSFHKFIDS